MVLLEVCQQTFYVMTRTVYHRNVFKYQYCDVFFFIVSPTPTVHSQWSRLTFHFIQYNNISRPVSTPEITFIKNRMASGQT